MKRDYSTGTSEDIILFTGVEVEKTPAFGLKTLFVTGIQDDDDIFDCYHKNKCKHIFFGANHSYNPVTEEDFDNWETYITQFLKEGYMCSLDIPSTINLEWFLEGGLIEYDNFIPQLRVVIPYIEQWNYNTMVKIDDKGFEQSNPGVWCHSLHDLMDRSKFTNWSKYKDDIPVDNE
jgi:hypothetical protein